MQWPTAGFLVRVARWDVLGSQKSFAILPDFDSPIAPLTLFNTSTSTANLIKNSSDAYANADIKVGDRVYLSGSSNLAAGFYTLLPARYALLPGGLLVNPTASPVSGNYQKPDGASVVGGYLDNSLGSDSRMRQLISGFEIAPQSVFKKRSLYETKLANSSLGDAAGSSRAFLPRDSGHLVFQSTEEMILAGQVSSRSLAGGAGAAIDIASHQKLAHHRRQHRKHAGYNHALGIVFEFPRR
jgi:hypothetical protein